MDAAQAQAHARRLVFAELRQRQVAEDGTLKAQAVVHAEADGRAEQERAPSRIWNGCAVDRHAEQAALRVEGELPQFALVARDRAHAEPVMHEVFTSGELDSATEVGRAGATFTAGSAVHRTGRASTAAFTWACASFSAARTRACVAGRSAFTGAQLRREQEQIGRQTEQALREFEKRNLNDPKTRDQLAQRLNDVARQEAQAAQRLGRLEKLALSLDGVQQAFAIQAGREIRVVVSPSEVTDDRAREIAKELRKRIEAELQYPSTIKITVIRESRFTETAT